MTAMADYGYSQSRGAVGNITPAGGLHNKPQPDPMGMRQQPSSPTHYHSRTVSSSIFPAQNQGTAPPMPAPYNQKTAYGHEPQHRRNGSVSTTSTSASGAGNMVSAQYLPQQYQQQPPINPAVHSLNTQNMTIPYRSGSGSPSSAELRRSGSALSRVSTATSTTPPSYVALMRKQKATVWCERTQTHDARMAQQARIAKQRAAAEVLGQSQGRSFTAASVTGSAGYGGGVRSKIRHGGAKTTTAPSGFSANMGANLAAGVGVPMRLSASEVGEEESDDEMAGSAYNRRTGSGRSSLGGSAAGLRLSAVNPATRQPGRLSTSSTPPSGQASPPAILEPEAAAAAAAAAAVAPHRPTEQLVEEKHNSAGSHGSEEGFGNVGDLLAPSSSRREGAGASKDDLARRGSVDERSATLRGAGALRLFVANPDASDSD